MRKFLITVSFLVEQPSAFMAEGLLDAKLVGSGNFVRDDFDIGSVEIADLEEGEVYSVSQELLDVLSSEILCNDEDESGWGTTLDYCYDSAKDPNNGVSETIQEELGSTIIELGGGTPAAFLLPGYKR